MQAQIRLQYAVEEIGRRKNDEVVRERSKCELVALFGKSKDP